MIRREIKGLKGKIIVELIPENEADELELERMIEAGEVDARDSFSDDPAAWEDDTDEPDNPN